MLTLRKFIPLTLLTLALVLTLLFGHEFYTSYNTLRATEDRLDLLSSQQSLAVKNLETTPKTLERTRTKTIREESKEIIQYVERSTESTDLPPKTATPVKPKTRERTVTIVEKLPNPDHQRIEQQLRDATIEIEAEGIKLRMINEATWTAIFKLCFLWFFLLCSLSAYKYFNRRYVL